VDHVKWFRDCADHDHFCEEVQILEAEFDRTIVSHQRMAEVWCQLVGEASRPGSTANAHKKAEMYHGLANQCAQAAL
jgi:hypothetical protein